MTFTPREDAQLLPENHQTAFVILIKARVCRVLQRAPPQRSDVIRWIRLFLETGQVGHRGGKKRPGTSKETFPQV